MSMEWAATLVVAIGISSIPHDDIFCGRSLPARNTLYVDSWANTLGGHRVKHAHAYGAAYPLSQPLSDRDAGAL